MKAFLRILFLIIIIGILSFIVYVFARKNESPAIDDNAAVATSTTKATEKSTGQQPAVLPEVTKTISETTSKYAIHAEYPTFSTLPVDFNTSIKAAVEYRVAEFKEQVEENVSSSKNPEFTFNSKWVPVYLNSKYASFILRFDSYTGGANENQEIETFNYDVAKKKVVKLGDLFPGSTTYLKSLSELSRKALVKMMNEDGESAPVDMINEGTKPLLENFRFFNFTETSIIIYFPKYSVGPGAFGEQQVVIPLSQIK